MRRFFAKNLLFVISVNLLVKPVWVFLIDRTVQNNVGHASYGIYQALLNLGIVFQILLDFGINSYNSRAVAQHPKRLRILFPPMLTARLALSLFYFFIVCAIGWIIGYRGWQIGLLAGVLLIQTLNSLLQFLRSNLTGLHHFKADGVLSITDRALMIFVCGFLLLYPPTRKHFQIEWFVAAQIACYGIAVIIGFFMVKKISGLRLYFSFDLKRLRNIIRNTLPYAVIVFLMSVYTRSDMMLVERLSGADGSEQAGIYAAAYRLLDVGNMIGLMFATMLLPVFGRLLAEKEDVHPIVDLALGLLVPASLIVSITAVFFRVEIMHFLYVHPTQEGILVFAWLMIAFPAFSISNIFCTLLTAANELRLLIRIVVAAAVLNLTMNFLLIPFWHALGAAITACTTQCVVAILFAIFSHRKVKIAVSTAKLLRLLMFASILLIAGYGIQLLPLVWILQAVLLLGLGGILLLLFGFLPLHFLKQWKLRR